MVPPTQGRYLRPETDERVKNIGPARSTPVVEIKLSLRPWQGSEFSFGDFIDIINPLQHIPVISTLYRMFTGDQIGSLPRLFGGALYGRLMGIPSLISSVVNAVVGIATGKDIGEHVFAFISGSERDPNSETEIQTARGPAEEVDLDEVFSTEEQPYGINANAYGPAPVRDARVIRPSRAPLRAASAVERGLEAIAERRLEPAGGVKANKPTKQIVFEPVSMPFQSWSGKAPVEVIDLYERTAWSNSELPDYLSAARRE
jgi:hypothetical protein